MEEYLKDMKGYWEKRFTKGGNIWGESPSRTAIYALELFRKPIRMGRYTRNRTKKDN